MREGGERERKRARDREGGRIEEAEGSDRVRGVERETGRERGGTCVGC